MIKRKPSQYEDLAQDDDLAAAEKAVPTDDVVDSDIIDIAGESDRAQTPSNNNRQSQAIGRMVAGAAPTLFGFLFGPQQSERGIAQTQKFYAGGKPSKLVPIIGEDGSPVYETPEGAIGEKVYQKPVGTKGPSGAGLSNINLVHRESGKPTVAVLNKATNQMVEAGTGQPLSMTDYAPAIDTREQVKTKDMYGNESLKIIPKFGDVDQGKTVGLSKGIGAQYKVPEYAVKQADSVVRAYQQDIKPLNSLDRTIKSALSNLNAPTSESVAQAAGMFQTAKVVAQEKMTDADRAAVEGEASLFSNLMGEFSKAVNNEQRQNVVDQMKGILFRINDINQKALADYKTNAVVGYSGSDENKLKLISERLDVPESVKSAPITGRTAPVAQKSKPLTKQQWDALPAKKKQQILKGGR